MGLLSMSGGDTCKTYKVMPPQATIWRLYGVKVTVEALAAKVAKSVAYRFECALRGAVGT
jgi:hypothetical protein